MVTFKSVRAVLLKRLRTAKNKSLLAFSVFLSAFFLFSSTATLADNRRPTYGGSGSHSGQMDTDGILSPGEIPNPRIDYSGRPYPDRHDYDPHRNDPHRNDHHQNNGGCYGENRGRGRPHIEIYRVKPTGNLFGDKIKVSGSIEGVCLVDAGLFENGRKVQEIPVAKSQEFARFDFEVTTKQSKSPEIRVYNNDGDRDVVPIHDLTE